MRPKNTICLWFDNNANEAGRFSAATFPDSKVTTVHKTPGDYPGGKAGNELIVEFTVVGIPCIGINGGPTFKHSEAFSFGRGRLERAQRLPDPAAAGDDRHVRGRVAPRGGGQ